MATKTRKENQKRSDKGSSTRRAAARTSAPSTRKTETSAEKKAAKKKPEAKTAADQTSEKPGADLLENAAEVVVSTQCEELARGLMKAAKEGNASCAKMLVELTEKVRIQKGANAKKGRSAANLLASEAEWTGVEEAGSQAGSSANEAMTQ